MAKLTIIHGPTSSGKTTRAQEISNETGARVWDDFSAHENQVIVIAPGTEVEFIATNYKEEK
jgi:tRNA uridine 5-carbamoylmethylation protein Kti12